MGLAFLCSIIFIVLFVSFFIGFFISFTDIYIAIENTPATEHLIPTQEQQDNSFAYTAMWLDID